LSRRGGSSFRFCSRGLPDRRFGCRFCASRRAFVGCRMSQCRGLVSRLRRLSGPARRLRSGGSRTSHIRPGPRGSFGGHSAVLQCRYARGGASHSRMRGNAMICRSKIRLVLLRNLLVLMLRCCRWNMFLAGESLLLRSWPGGNSVRATIKAGVVVIDDRRVVDNRCIHISVPDHRPVHVYCRCVVSEDPTAPLAAGKAASTITEAIVNAAVKAYLRSPIAFMEDIDTAVSPAPISRRPKIARLRSLHPCARHPIVVTNAIPCPVTGRPHKVGLGAGRLNVNRNRRRLDIDTDAN
jgi:hypothetical protein